MHVPAESELSTAFCFLIVATSVERTHWTRRRMTGPQTCSSPGEIQWYSSNASPGGVRLFLLVQENIPTYKMSSVGWGCRMHQLLLCREVTPLPRVSWIWHKTIWWRGSSNGEILGMQSTHSLPSHTGPLWPGLVVPDRVLSMAK